MITLEKFSIIAEIHNFRESRSIYQDILWSLFRKMNVPAEEARDKMAKLEDGGMGNLFASMEKMDIQAERRNTQLARQEAEAAKQRLEESDRELKETFNRLSKLFSQLVSVCRNSGMSREEILVCLQERYGLSEAEAASALEQFWQQK